MMNWLRRDTPGSDELGRDMVVAEALESLDPASLDPNYWFRFHGRVMAGAESELSRRRMLANLTVVDVLASWSRTVVPTAMLAAAVAALMLMQTGSGAFDGLGAVADDSDNVVPALMPAEAPVSFASLPPEIF